MSSPFLSAALCLALSLLPAKGFANNRLNDGDPVPGDGDAPILTEPEQPELIVPDNLGTPINIDDLSQFDQNPAASDTPASTPSKRWIDPLITSTCEAIRQVRDHFPQQTISRVTQYYTPMFEPGETGKLQSKDRRACINVEGACIVEKYLYNWSSSSEPWGHLYERNDIKFKFGRGAGQSYYNATNALDPCRTVAADTDKYPVGTVLYIPAMRDKLCPQNGKPIDGCFIVGDVGAAIQGSGRFDFFTGECARYDKGTNSCSDSLMDSFAVPKGTPFYVVGRHNILAKELREETDLLINNNWLSGEIH